MKEYHNFEENSFMTENNGTVYIRITIPELGAQKCLQFQLDDTVWQAKQRILQAFAKDLRDPLNYGLYLPPINGRAGKFLDEERVLQEYPLQGPIGFLEFKYKRRVYKVMQINPRKLKQLHTKSNLKIFLECVRSGNIDKINKATSKGLDPNFHDQDNGETPLTIAVTLGRDKCRDVIISLISGGSHIDFRNKQGLSPMHRAAIVGSIEAVKTLLDLGASPNYKDARGLTPIYYCVSNDTNPLCAEILLHERSQINIQDEQGWYEIHQACRCGRVQHLEHLLYYGADIDVQNASGNTPLHVCAINNQESCARVLLFRGANNDIVNYNNQSAHEVAVIASNFELAEIIKSYKTEDAVPYREIPKYSDRRKMTMLTPSLRALVRSRSDPRLNISSIEEQFMQSSHSHMTELYGSYSPSRDYNSDSPRSLSISSTSSGPGHIYQEPRLYYYPRKRLYPAMPGRMFVCVKNYFPCHLAELSLTKGDIVEVLSVGDQGYYEGRVDNREGWFPSNHVQEVMMRRAGSHGDIMESGAKIDRNTLFALVQADREYAPRTILLQKGSEGFGFVLRGAKSQTRAASLDFQPTPEFPALQYLDSVDIDSQADRVGLKSGDFLLEINDENVVRASHERVVQLIRSSRERIKMKVVTVRPMEKDNDWFIHQDGAMTLPNRIKRLAPAPPKRDPQTSLSYSKGTSRSMAEGMEEIAKLDQIVAEFEGQTIGQRSSVMKPPQPEPKIASVRASHAAKRVSVVDLDNIMVNDVPDSKSNYKSPSELRIQKYHKKQQNGIMERSKSTPDLVAEIEAQRKGEAIYARANIQTGSGQAVYNESGASWNRSPTSAHKAGSPHGSRAVSYVGAVRKPPVYMDPSLLHAGVYSGSYAKQHEEPKYMIPVVPGRNPIPKRPAPPPPTKGEVVSINTTASSSNGIYANVSEEIQVRKKEESPYESSFRPGTLARLSKHPQVLTNSLEQAKLKAHQRSASMGNIDMPLDTEDKPSVSFAEDKVFQNAASFIQKHPNATLLVTTDVYKGQNKPGKYYEPEPDYDDNSDEDRKRLSKSRAQSSDSSISSLSSAATSSDWKASTESSPDLQKNTVTVISINGDHLKKDSHANKQYTIHSDIPSSNSSGMSLQSGEAGKIIIPPRPNEPAPLPPSVSSSSNSSRRSSVQSNFSGDRDNMLEKMPGMQSAYYNQNNNKNIDKVYSSISTTRLSPSFVHRPPPESAPPPPPPAPALPAALAPSAAAPPPPPLPSTDPPQLRHQNSKPQTITPVVSSSDIMAAVAKRKARLDTEGPRMTEEKPVPPKDPVLEKLNMNQEALKAAVARRKDILKQNADTAVVDSIEARLQKTKKLQAAKYFFSSDTMKRGNTNQDTGEAESKESKKKEESAPKAENQVKSVFSSSTLKSATKSNANSALPKSTKTVPAPVPVKPITTVQKSPPKPAPKIDKPAPKIDKPVTKVDKPVTKVDKPITKVDTAVEKVDNPVAKVDKPAPKPESNKTKSDSQPSDFLAMAEKRRQEYIKRKSIRDDGSSADTLPRTKSSSQTSKASPSSDNSKTIEVVPAKQTNASDDSKISIKDRIAKLEKGKINLNGSKKENVEVIGVTKDHSHTEDGLTLNKRTNQTNGYNFVAPPPGFGDAGHSRAGRGVVQIDIIPPPAHFANESSTDDNLQSAEHCNSAFGHDDAASQVSSVSTISTLSSEHGEGSGLSRTSRSYEIAPPPPGFDDSSDSNYEEVQTSGFIPPPPEFGSSSQEDSNRNKPLRPFQTKPVDSWLCTDVMDWLDSLNMSQYKSGFAKNCIDGPKLQGLGRNDYIQLGVVQVGHRMNLERSIKKVAMGKLSTEVIRL